MWTQESLISVQPDGTALIPMQNFQGMPIRLGEGVRLGVVSQCELPDEPKPEPCEGMRVPLSGTCACIKALSNTPKRESREVDEYAGIAS